MNIDGVRGGASPQPAANANPQLKAIDKQISDIRKRIQETKANKNMDAKTKSEKIRQYQEQIALLEQQKAQIQTQARKAKTEENMAKSASKPQQPKQKGKDSKEAPEPQISEATQRGLIQMGAAKEVKHALGAVRADMQGKLRIAESKSYLREPDPKAAATLRGKIADIDSEYLSRAQGASEIMQAEDAPAAQPEEALTSEEARENNENPGEAKNKKAKKRGGTGRMEPGQFLYEEA